MSEKYLTMRSGVGGMFHGIEGGVKAGQTLVIDDHLGLREQADHYAATGLANYGETVTGPAFVADEELSRKVAREDRAKWEREHPECAPRPGSEPIFTPRQQVANNGWV
ncbi:hypothetical protein CRM90_27920 [Mycobacterium sp. ENV421]|uniref:hypothetical protein n=1 Tax=Mycobacterium sp. ENV421 TaxID=1213407 RepID=UPI000C99A239|nr:hypothetical protein [Mycobacterium sp. ENV421]PND54430.1 hypothetical protein CRM90_27920 [Mycobacterium sp. ENV421]